MDSRIQFRTSTRLKPRALLNLSANACVLNISQNDNIKIRLISLYTGFVSSEILVLSLL